MLRESLLSWQKKSRWRLPSGLDSSSTCPLALMTDAKRTESKTFHTSSTLYHLSFIFIVTQVCHLHGWIHGRWFSSLLALYAYIPRRVHWWLAHAQLYLPVLHGACWISSAIHLRNQLKIAEDRQVEQFQKKHTHTVTSDCCVIVKNRKLPFPLSSQVSSKA